LLIALFIAAAVYVSVRESRRRRQRLIRTIRKSWGKISERKLSDDELKIISHYAADCRDGLIPCEESDYIDDITWNDISMDSVFMRMNTCFSSVGQEYLYKMLRLPFNSVEKVKETDRLATYFKDSQDERESLQKIYYRLGFAKKISVSDYVGLLMECEASGNAVHYMSILLIIASLALMLGINAVAGVLMLVASLAFTIISYYSYKAKVEPYYLCMMSIVRMVCAAKAVAGLGISEISGYSDRLRSIAGKMEKLVKASSLLASPNENGSITEILLDYIRMITHIDIIKFNNMLKTVNEFKEDIYELMRILGYLEATISVSSYRESLKYWCRPQFAASGRSMAAEDVYHPCIENPVANSIAVTKNVLLTGSNASGKSTFLKTIAINALLSQAVGTSTAKSYRAPIYRIYSSMALKDNLEGHDSYYIVEIKSLKRILDSIGDDKLPVLCFIDEVLRGTNTIERIAASSQILKSLSDRNVMCFAATHDIELTKILDGYYENYHFREDFDDDVVFNYKLTGGAATSRNAIRLLKDIGYDASIITASENIANRFITTGDWC
jgi:hypothetical protein